MSSRKAYVALCIAGAVVPFAAFFPWLVVHGLDLPLLVHDLFANRVSAFFGLDVLVSAVVVFVFAHAERPRVKLWWLPIIAVLFVGVSFGLPLLLALREGPEPA